MKPWMGAIAAAVAIAAAPSAALADDGVSVVQFKLPDKAAIETFEGLGADLDRGFRPAPGGGVLVSAVVDACRAGTLPGARLPRRQNPPDAGLRRRAARRARGDDRVRGRRLQRAHERRGEARQERGRGHGPRAARGLLGGRLGRLPLDRGLDARRHDERQQLHRPAARRRVVRRRRHATRHRQPVGADRRGPVPLPRLPLPGRRPRHADAGQHPRRGAQRRRRHAGRQALDRRQRHHEPRRLHPGLRHPLRHAARGLREGPPALERVPGHRRAAAAAEQDQRLPAQGADRDRQRHAVHGPVVDRQLRLGRRPDVRRLGPRGRQPPDRRDQEPRRARRAARGHRRPATRSPSPRRPTPTARSPAPPRRSSPRSTPARRPATS